MRTVSVAKGNNDSSKEHNDFLTKFEYMMLLVQIMSKVVELTNKYMEWQKHAPN